MKAKSNNYRGKVDISVSQNFITSKNTIYKFSIIIPFFIIFIISCNLYLNINFKYHGIMTLY